MEKKFWDIPEMYRQALGMNNLGSYSTDTSSNIKVPSCINDNFCKESPKNFSNILTMVFGDMQPLDSIYSLDSSFKNGTLFPNLDKPFYGGMKK